MLDFISKYVDGDHGTEFHYSDGSYCMNRTGNFFIFRWIVYSIHTFLIKFLVKFLLFSDISISFGYNKYFVDMHDIQESNS